MRGVVTDTSINSLLILPRFLFPTPIIPHPEGPPRSPTDVHPPHLDAQHPHLSPQLPCAATPPAHARGHTALPAAASAHEPLCVCRNLSPAASAPLCNGAYHTSGTSPRLCPLSRPPACVSASLPTAANGAACPPRIVTAPAAVDRYTTVSERLPGALEWLPRCNRTHQRCRLVARATAHRECL